VTALGDRADVPIHIHSGESMTHHTIRRGSRPRRWTEAHAFASPVVREIPRPVGPGSLDEDIW
jgi:hypothetical protein